CVSYTFCHSLIRFFLLTAPPTSVIYTLSLHDALPISVFDPDIGEVTIERLDHVENGAARCYTPDGQQFDERWLHKKLGGIQRKTYQAIFSFSARDLVHIARMKEEDIGEVLLG